MNFRFTFALLLVAGRSFFSEAAQTEGSTPPSDDVAFCKEVLILHHSHVDVGYTHPQSMYWELQKGYLDAALDMLDRTENWPDDLSARAGPPKPLRRSCAGCRRPLPRISRG